MNAQASILVTGGSGLLGSRLLLKLSESGYQVAGMGRGNKPLAVDANYDWKNYDLTTDQPVKHRAQILIHCAPLWLLPSLLKQLLPQGHLKRCIAMSSTSAIAKADAEDGVDRELAARLLDAENCVKEICTDKIATTILRPTLIYGYGGDKNISVIATFIRKFGFFPIAGKAHGLRQPVHVDDLVKAITTIIENPQTFAKTYALAGSQTLSYRAMLEKIFSGLDKPARIVRLPVWVYRLLIAMAGGDYSPGSANRMNQDLNYDIEAAIKEFNYQPQAFLENPGIDLP